MHGEGRSGRAGAVLKSTIQSGEGTIKEASFTLRTNGKNLIGSFVQLERAKNAFDCVREAALVSLYFQNFVSALNQRKKIMLWLERERMKERCGPFFKFCGCERKKDRERERERERENGSQQLMVQK
jgi:hypothetical protein